MKFIQHELELTLVLPKPVMGEIRRLAQLHYPKEYGGFLIGHYSPDGAIAMVTQVLCPQLFRSSATTFERDASGLEKELSRLYTLPEPQFYIGEWHSHPNGPTTPSGTDLRAMAHIAAHPSVKIKSPILLIAGVDKQKVWPDLYIYSNQKLNRYEKI